MKEIYEWKHFLCLDIYCKYTVQNVVILLTVYEEIQHRFSIFYLYENIPIYTGNISPNNITLGSKKLRFIKKIFKQFLYSEDNHYLQP